MFACFDSNFSSCDSEREQKFSSMSCLPTPRSAAIGWFSTDVTGAFSLICSLSGPLSLVTIHLEFQFKSPRRLAVCSRRCHALRHQWLHRQKNDKFSYFLLFTTMNNHNLFSEIKTKWCPLQIVQVLAIFDNKFWYCATFQGKFFFCKSQNVALP